MEENKNMNVENEEVKEEQEAFDKASFADVNYGAEDKKEDSNNEKKKETKNSNANNKKVPKGLIIAGISVASVILILIIAWLVIRLPIFDGNETVEKLRDVTSFGGNKEEVVAVNDMGLANAYNNPIGVTKDGYLYHSNFSSTALYRTKLDSESLEQEKLMDISSAFFASYNNDIYFYDGVNKKLMKYVDAENQEVVYEGDSYYHQYVGEYVYFLTPEANYGGFVRRVPLKGGDAEIVLNVYTSCFHVSGENIVYYDNAINTLCKIKLDDAIAHAAAAGGNANNSSDIKAIALAEQYAYNICVKDQNVYFSDVSDNNIIYRVGINGGEVTKMNFGTVGRYLNVYKDYIFYVGEDNHLYRMNIDGKDIRDLTGASFKEIAGFGIYGENIVFYALMGELNPDTMQNEYFPVIGVMNLGGKPSIVIPADTLEDRYESMGMPEIMEDVPEITEIPEITEEETSEETAE